MVSSPEWDDNIDQIEFDGVFFLHFRWIFNDFFFVAANFDKLMEESRNVRNELNTIEKKWEGKAKNADILTRVWLIGF